MCDKRYIDSLYFIYNFTYFNKANKGLRPSVCPAFCHVQRDKHLEDIPLVLWGLMGLLNTENNSRRIQQVGLANISEGGRA